MQVKTMKMNTKIRSIGEMMKNPDSWTDEEEKDINKMMEKFGELAKSLKAYNVNTELANNTTNDLSQRFYKEFFIMAAILEAFFSKDEISFKELNQSIYNYVPKEFLWDITVNYQNLIISKMIRLGFLEVIKTEDKYLPTFKITSEGIKIYQAQQLQNLAASSFFSFQTLSLSKKTQKLNVKMYWLTILMLIVTICSVIVTVMSLKNNLN